MSFQMFPEVSDRGTVFLFGEGKNSKEFGHSD